MEFSDYIEAGIEKAGSKAALARDLGMEAPTLHAIIKGKRPMTADALAKLALLIGGDVTPGQIWEAQQAARAESEEERQLWMPFLQMRHAAAIAAVTAICVTGMAESPTLPEIATGPVFIMSSWMAAKWIKNALRKILRQPV